MTKVNSINVCPAELTLAKGEWYYDASVSVCPESADCKEVTWSSDNTSVATVNPSTGYIYAQSNGVAKIYATAADGSGCNDYICLTVTDFVPVAAVYIKGLDIRIEKGSCKKLDLEIYPENATNKVFSWHSNNTSVATVEDGVVYGVSEGIAQICVVPEDGGNGDGGCQLIGVTTDVLVRSITISSSELTLRVGESTVLNAAVTPANATNSGLLWVSTNEKVVTVNPFSGIVNAIGEGTASIYAKSRDGSNLKSCYCEVTVEKAIPVTSITIDPPDMILGVGESMSLTATVLPTNATNKALRWYSKNPDIATVDEYSGLVYGEDFGCAEICASARDNSGVEASCVVDVDYHFPITKVHIPQKAVTLHVGETYRVDAQTCPLYATETAEIKYSTSNPYVATVDKDSGEVTAISGGIAIITATASTTTKTFSVDCKITVDPREKVKVKKDGDFFTVTFKNGKIWKSVGVDMSLEAYRSGNSLDINVGGAYFTDYELRAKWNFENFYTEKEFALLYLLDPWGVEFYLNSYDVLDFIEQFPGNYENYDEELKGVLKFKDRIYKEIFGVSPTPFTLSDNGQRVDVYGSYNRLQVYTDAELMFGTYSKEDIWELLEHAVDIILDIFDKLLPDTTKNKLILSGVNFAKTLLFTGSIVKALNGAAVDLLELYVDKSSNGKIELMEWPNSLFLSISEFKSEVDSVLNLANITDVEIYHRLKKQENYHVEFCVNSRYLFMEKIVELCS